MKLEQFHGKAIKGQTFTHALGAINLIYGPNDRGKTARTDAIRLLFLGHLPEHGKTNPATFALASASKMEVGGTLTGYGGITRTWTKSGKAVKATCTPADIPETPLVMLNAAEYFGKSDRGKVDMLFDVLQLDPSKWDVSGTRERIIHDTKDSDRLKDIRSLLADEGDTVQQWMDACLEAVSEAQKVAAAEVDRYAQMAQGLATLGLDETPLDPDRVAADMRTARAKLEELTRLHGELTQQAKHETETATRRAELGRTIQQLKAELGDRPLPDSEGEELTRELRELEAERAALHARHQDAVAAANERAKRRQRAETLAHLIADADRMAATEKQLDETLHKIQDELQELGPDTTQAAAKAVTDATAEKATILAQRATIEADLKAAGERFERLTTCAACPTCGTEGKHLQELVQAQYEATKADLDNAMATLDHKFAEVTTAINEAQARQNKALENQRRRQALERQAGETTTAVAKASHAAATAEGLRRELEAIGDTSGTQPEPPARLAELAPLIAGLVDDIKRLAFAERLAEKSAEMEAIGATAEEAAQRAAHVDDEIEIVRERIEELTRQQQQVDARAGEAKRLVEAQEAREKQDARVAVLKALQKTIVTERALMIAETFGPLLQRVNVFTKGILPTPLEYREGELGRFNGASWVPVRAFGGAFTAVTYAGIQAALGSTGPARLVIVDELGRFDPKNKRRFIENVAEAIEAGLLEQFIGIDVSNSDYGMDGLTLIDVGAQ